MQLMGFHANTIIPFEKCVFVYSLFGDPIATSSSTVDCSLRWQSNLMTSSSLLTIVLVCHRLQAYNHGDNTLWATKSVTEQVNCNCTVYRLHCLQSRLSGDPSDFAM